MYIFGKQAVTSSQHRGIRISRRMKVPPWNSRVVSPAWWYIFVECVSSVKRIVYCLFVCLFCSIFTFLSRESDGGAIFWTNLYLLRSCPFPSFSVLWLFTIVFAACSKPPSRDNNRKVPYPRTQQQVRWEWELNLVHAIVITRSP